MSLFAAAARETNRNAYSRVPFAAEAGRMCFVETAGEIGALRVQRWPDRHRKAWELTHAAAFLRQASVGSRGWRSVGRRAGRVAARCAQGYRRWIRAKSRMRKE